MASGAQSKVRLLIEIAETGGENIDKLAKQLSALTSINNASAAKGLTEQTKATDQLVSATQRRTKATKDLTAAQKEADQSANAKSLANYTSLSKEDLKIQQARLKQALLHKRENARIANDLEIQRRKTSEQAAALREAEAATKAANRATAQAVKDQEKLAAAVDAANAKLIQQGLAQEKQRQASLQKLQDVTAAADARAQKEALRVTAAREAAERKLTAALEKQQATADKLKQKTLEAAQAEKEHAKQTQAVLKESLKKKKALRDLAVQLEQYKRKLHEMKNPTNSFVDGLENAASTAALIQGPLGGVASRIGTLATILKDVNPKLAATVLGVGTLATGFGVAIIQAGKTEAQLLKLEAIIKATGSAAGFTVGQVDRMSKALAESTIGDAAEARDAIAKLLTFKGIQDDNFERALVVLSDMAAVFGSLDEASVQLGKALEDPIQGLGSLREIGVSVTQEQQDLIKELQRSGNLWLAQQEVLSILESQIGGAGAAQGGGLVGAFETLTERFSSLLKTIGEGAPLKAATHLFRELGNAIQFVESLIAGSRIDVKMQDIADQSDVLRQKLKDISSGKLDASAKSALEAQLNALEKQSVEITKQRDLLEERAKLQEKLARTEKQRQLEQKAGIESTNSTVLSLFNTAKNLMMGSKVDAASSFNSIWTSDREDQIKSMKEELEGLNAQLVDYDKATKAATDADKEATRATQRAQGLKVQEQQIQDLNKQKKTLDRAYAQQQIRTLQQETDAQVAAEEERFRRGEQGLQDYLNKRTSLEKAQSERQRVILKAESDELADQYQARLNTIEETNKKIRASGGLEIRAEGDQEALRLMHAARIAAEELNRFELEAKEGLVAITKTQREEQEKLNQASEQGARQSERDARKAKADAEALQKVLDDANEKRRKAVLELRSLEIDGAGAVEARMQLAADVIAESFKEARDQIAEALGEEQAKVVDQLIDTKSVHAQFDALEQIYSERISRLGVIVTNLQVQKDRGKISYQDFIQGAADAYAAADEELVKLIERMRQLAEASGSSELKNKLIELETQFETTAAAGEQFTVGVIDTLKNASAGIAESGFQSFFDSIFEDITDLEGAFRSLGMTILQELQKIVSSRIAAEFASMIGGLFEGPSGGGGGSSGGGWLSAAASFAGSFFADGGRVRGPGTTTSDSIPAMLSNHEFVLPARSTALYGFDTMEALRRGQIDPQALRSLWTGAGMRNLSVRIPRTPHFSEGGLVTNMGSSPETMVPQQPPSVEVYNILDPSEMLRRAMGTRDGKTIMVNWARDNRTDIQKMWKGNK